MTLTPPPANPFSPELHNITWETPPAVNLPRAYRAGWLAEALKAAPQDRAHFGGCLMCRGYGGRSGRTPAPVGPFILPVPQDVPFQKIEVHTLRWGNPDWMQECAPTMDAWCARHGLPLHITTSWDPSYPDPKFCEVDMLKSFLAGDNDWMFFIDADTVFHPLAPRPHFPEPGFWIREDTHGRANTRWFAWCMEKFGETPDPDYLYRNAGVWACDRESARRMLEVIEKPYHEGIMEQDQWNWWISRAVTRGMELNILPHEWNRFPREKNPSWVFHIYSKAKLHHLLNFRAAGLLPDAVKRLDPEPDVPDFGHGAVIWPWRSTSKPEEMLWWSCQSVLRHWSEKDWPLVLLGDRRPDWWPGEFIHAPAYETSMFIGSQCAENVVVMNDDVFMLANQSPQTLATARHLGDRIEDLGKLITAPGSWSGGLGQVLMRCHHHGRTTLNFSTHTPYLYQREKVREVLHEFGMFYKIPLESAYHNWHATPHAPCTEKADNPEKLPGMLWANLSPAQITPALRKEFNRRFGVFEE